jgi:hypothetical protein
MRVWKGSPFQIFRVDLDVLRLKIFQKIFQKGVDKWRIVWYNISTVKGSYPKKKKEVHYVKQNR